MYARYAAVVVPDLKGGEKRLVLAAVLWTGDVYDLTRQNSPLLREA